MSATTPDWRDELIRLGGSIRQDGDAPVDGADDAAQQAGIARYVEILDGLGVDSSSEDLAAVLSSLHPIEDYGVYESAYRVLSEADPAALGAAAARVLPGWLAEHGDHDSIAVAMRFASGSEAARDAFLAGATSWTRAQRATAVEALQHWMREDAGWSSVVESLGVPSRAEPSDPIPPEWPESWRAAATAFRDSGRVDLAWTNQRDFADNFPRVLALMELGHGSRWREVPDLLNPLLVRRRSALPAFIQALSELPATRRDRILSAVERARPDVAEKLAAALRGSSA